MITRLNVPYAEKDQAKALGARFNMAGKYWYVPDGLDLARFSKWLPAELQSWLATRLPRRQITKIKKF
jgi:exodeoxyribonuclease VII large subunit